VEGFETLLQYRTFRTITGGKTVRTGQCYVSGAAFFADESGKYIRGHRSVENNPHR
jgi:hypothetical protein